MMTTIQEAESTLTDRYQTTVPEPVRRALKLGKRDKIHYTIHPDGEVTLSRQCAADEEDPVLGEFIDFLAKDMQRHPEQLVALDQQFAQRLRSLTQSIEVDLHNPLPDEQD